MPNPLSAVSDLGFGGDDLDEERKKRLRDYQIGDATGSAAQDLLGSFVAGAKDWYAGGVGRLLNDTGPVDPMKNRKEFMSRRPR